MSEVKYEKHNNSNAEAHSHTHTHSHSHFHCHSRMIWSQVGMRDMQYGLYGRWAMETSANAAFIHLTNKDNIGLHVPFVVFASDKRTFV